jgi:putative membrane protein
MKVLLSAFGGENFHHDHGWDGGWFWLWGSLMMLIWAAAIGLVVWLVVRGAHRPSGSRAREILDERLARGELSVEEYRERRAHLD